MQDELNGIVKRKELEHAYAQWMKLLMFNISGMDVLNDREKSTQMTPEQMRASFSLGFRFALDRVSAFISQSDSAVMSDEIKIKNFLSEQQEVSYLSAHSVKSGELTSRLKRKDGWGFNKAKVLKW